jgi:hypothetical protein
MAKVPILLNICRALKVKGGGLIPMQLLQARRLLVPDTLDERTVGRATLVCPFQTTKMMTTMYDLE